MMMKMRVSSGLAGSSKAVFRSSITVRQASLSRPSSSASASSSRSDEVPRLGQIGAAVRGPARAARQVAAQASPAGNAATGKLISSTEVPAFIMRDDMMDQLYKWSVIEAGEGGFRNFGMPMNVEPLYRGESIWGFKVGIYKDGTKLTDIGVQFDDLPLDKQQWVGKGEDGFPVMEGHVDVVEGKNIEIWKLDMNPVTEDLRSTIRGYCTGLVGALNRFYAFGSVFVDDDRG